MLETSFKVFDFVAEPALHPRLINLRVVLLLLLVVTGCGEHVDQVVEKMAVQTITAKSMDTLRSGDSAAYIAMVRAENETDLGFKGAGLVEIIAPEAGAGWDPGTPVQA